MNDPNEALSIRWLHGHIDRVIVSGPDLVKSGLRFSKPACFAQLPIYTACMQLETALVTALNKDSCALHHEIVALEPAEAQALSGKAVVAIRAAGAGELPPRIAVSSDFHLCRFCPYAARCWKEPQA